MRRTGPTRLLPLALLLLAGCSSEELYTNLSETQANEMVAVLRNAGIDADKQPVAEAGWTVTTPSSDLPRAVGLLRQEGYPREEFQNLGTIFKKEGFVSSQLEERARLVFGLQQELSETVSQIDGVVRARVHLSLPAPDPMGQVAKPAAASILIRYRPGISMERQVGQIRALVVNSVEGLKYENVSVLLVPAQPLPSPPAPDPAQRVLASAAPMAAPVGLALLGWFGWPIFRRWRMARMGGQQPGRLLRHEEPRP